MSITTTRQRAKRGTGTYKTLPNGRILYSFPMPVDDNGVRRRASVTGRTEAECRELAAKRVARADAPPVSEEKLCDYLARWIAEAQVKPKTIETYSSAIRAQILPVIGPKKLKALTHRDVTRMMKWNSDRGLAPETVNLARTVLGVALKDALREGAVTENAVTLAKTLRVERHDVVPLTGEQVVTLLDSVSRTRWWPYYFVSVSTGLRPNELLALRWSDVAGAIRVEQNLHYRQGAYFAESPKTEKSRRTLPLLEPVRHALELQRAYQEQEREDAGSAWEEKLPDLVFRTKHGRPVDSDELNRQFKADLKAAGLREQPYKDLRHTCASYLFHSGVPMEVISKVLGHGSIAITAEVYAMVSQPLLAGALSNLAMLGAGSPAEIGDQIGERAPLRRTR